MITKKRYLFIGVISIISILHTHAIDEDMLYIEDRYGITSEKDCHVAINRYVNIYSKKKGLDHINHTMACLAAGYKDVFIISGVIYDPDLDEDLTPVQVLAHLDKRLKRIASNKNIKYLILKIPNEYFLHNNMPVSDYLNKPLMVTDVIFYTQNGQKNALMLAKNLLEQRLEIVNYSSCLMGMLLGYSMEDILFFHQAHGFIVEKNLDLLPSEFPSWPTPLKKEFETYEKEIWPTSYAFNNFTKSKKEAMEWLNVNENQTVSQLQEDISYLFDRLKSKALKESEKEAKSLDVQIHILQTKHKLLKSQSSAIKTDSSVRLNQKIK